MMDVRGFELRSSYFGQSYDLCATNVGNPHDPLPTLWVMLSMFVKGFRRRRRRHSSSFCRFEASETGLTTFQFPELRAWEV